MTPDEIINEMQQAYLNKVFVSGNEWKAYFSNGIEVHFYLDANGKIISFFLNINNNGI